MKFNKGDLVEVPGRIFCDSNGNLIGTIKGNIGGYTIKDTMYLVEINDLRFVEENDITLSSTKEGK